jgi:zinc transport system substrate-binding protein
MDTDAELAVTVSIQPQRYFVERIAGDLAEVNVLVPPDRGPATYEPTPRQVESLARSDVYFRIGVPFEGAFVPRIQSALPDLRIVDTSSGIERRSLEAHTHDDEASHDNDADHDEADHGEVAHDEADHGEGAHAEADHDGADHGEVANPDPHIWLSPPLVKRQARTIRDALIDLRPETAEQFRQNYASFAADIDALHRELTELLEPVEGETLFVFHPGFGYFGDAYGLEQEAIETGGDEPTAARLQELIREARAENVRVIFVQPQFATSAARRIAEAIDGAVVTVNPLAADWLSNMRHIAESVREGLE